VVLDVMMPVMDGRETLRRIRDEHDWLPGRRGR
jgi:CheY-like chemotaxis protein